MRSDHVTLLLILLLRDVGAVTARASAHVTVPTLGEPLHRDSHEVCGSPRGKRQVSDRTGASGGSGRGETSGRGG